MTPTFDSRGPMGGAAAYDVYSPRGNAFRARPFPIDYLFLLAIFFPYIQVIPIGTDVQPVAICAAVVVLLLGRRWLRAPGRLWLLGFVLVVALCVLVSGDIDFAALRS